MTMQDAPAISALSGAGGIARTGLFFVPALAVQAAGGCRLWRGQP